MLRAILNMEAIELPNEDKIGRIGKKETYKYLGILESNTIKYAEMKEKKFLKNTSREQKHNSKPNYITDTSSKRINTLAVHHVRY